MKIEIKEQFQPIYPAILKKSHVHTSTKLAGSPWNYLVFKFLSPMLKFIHLLRFPFITSDALGCFSACLQIHVHVNGNKPVCTF